MLCQGCSHINNNIKAIGPKKGNVSFMLKPCSLVDNLNIEYKKTIKTADTTDIIPIINRGIIALGDTRFHMYTPATHATIPKIYTISESEKVSNHSYTCVTTNDTPTSSNNVAFIFAASLDVVLLMLRSIL